MKTARKAIMAVLCVLCVIVASITGTLAYLTDTEAVTNTFTVGKVGISLDEADVDNSTEGDNDRDYANVYHLLPGQQYDKDPIVHVDADSEDAWLFVEVENGLMYDNNAKTIEVAAEISEGVYKTIHEQIVDNGWAELSQNGNKTIYYCAYDKDADPAKVDFPVFTNFKINGETVVNVPEEGENVPAGKVSIGDFKTVGENGKVINVTAYAIQMAGFENNHSAAWTALQNQLNPSTNP